MWGFDDDCLTESFVPSTRDRPVSNAALAISDALSEQMAFLRRIRGRLQIACDYSWANEKAGTDLAAAAIASGWHRQWRPWRACW